MKTRIALAGGLLALLSTTQACAGNVHAQAGLQAWQVQNVATSGASRQKAQPLQQLRPGDVVEYQARYVNGTAQKAEDVQVTLPVPAGGIQYLPQSDSATPVHSASVDGVRFEPVPLRRVVRRADGMLLIQEVPLSEYRFLRWNLGDLPAGAQRVVRARMQLPL